MAVPNGISFPNTQPPLLKKAESELVIDANTQEAMRLDYMTGKFTCQALADKYMVGDVRVIAEFVRKKNWLRDLVSKGMIPPVDQVLLSGQRKRYGMRGRRGKEFENELRRAFLDPTLTVETIARIFGISVHNIMLKANAKGWTPIRLEIENAVLRNPRAKLEFAMSGLIDESSSYIRKMIRMEQENPGDVMDKKAFQRMLDSFSSMCKSAADLLSEKQVAEEVMKKVPVKAVTPLALQLVIPKAKPQPSPDNHPAA